jgi:hypothetical protein
MIYTPQSNTRAQDWPYHSHEDLVDAGYLLRTKCRCGARGCGLMVLVYGLVNEMPVGVDPVTFQPHITVCGNPERVAAQIREEDARRKPAKDGKSSGAGDKL